MLIAIYISLMALALGLFSSMTFVALSHIFIIVPCFYFLNKTSFKNWSKSSYFLAAICFSIVLSIFVNQDIMVDGFKAITKVKYYLIALLSIAPYSYWWLKLSSGDEAEKIKKVRWLLIAFFIVTTIASLSGMTEVFAGFNPLRWKPHYAERNGGLAGMLMNYAHNLAMFQIILIGMIINRNETKKFINLNFLYVVFVINLVGLYTTYTRGAWLAFLIAIPFFFLKSHKKYFVGIVVVLAVTGFGVYKFSGKNVIRPVSDIERTSQWEAAIVGFKQRPVLGLGFLNFEKLSFKIKEDNNIAAPKYGGHAHSNYFEMLASTGLMGFISFMLWLGFWFYEMFKRNDLIAKIAIGFIVSFAVGGLTQATFVLGANLFFILSVYALTQIDFKLLKNEI